MAITYFGTTSVPGGWDGGVDHDLVQGNHKTNAGYLCPGSGLQNVKELSSYCKQASGSGKIRMAIYDSAGNRKAAGNSEVSVTSVTGAWVGHDEAGLTIDGTLIAGTKYAILWGADNNITEVAFVNNGSGLAALKTPVTYHTDGYPATYPSMSTANGSIAIRCGVEPVPPTPRFLVMQT